MRTAIAGLVLLSAACSDAAPPANVSDDPVVTEQNGTRTVLNRAPAWAEDEQWTVSPDPTLRIGMLEGPPEYLFDRVEGVARLSDGTIAVLNAGDGQLRFYGSDGTHLRSVGRVGDGPGEMRAARWLDRLEGDVLQVTHTAGRLRYAPDGELIRDDRLDWNRIHDVGRRASLDGAAGFLMESCDIPAPLFLDDSVLLCGSSYTDVRFMPEEAGLHQSHSMVARAGWELGAVDTLGIFETRSLVMYQDDGRLRSWFLGEVQRPRGWLNVTGSPSQVTFATSASYRIEVYDLESAERRLVIERAAGLRAPTGPELERLEEWPPDPYNPGRGRPSTLVRAQVGAVDSLSILAAAPHVDATGAIWAPLHVTRGDSTRPFDVFDSGGIHLGRVTLPSGFSIHEIGADYILGVARGEFSEQYVVMYELDRGAPG